MNYLCNIFYWTLKHRELEDGTVIKLVDDLTSSVSSPLEIDKDEQDSFMNLQIEESVPSLDKLPTSSNNTLSDRSAPLPSNPISSNNTQSDRSAPLPSNPTSSNNTQSDRSALPPSNNNQNSGEGESPKPSLNYKQYPTKNFLQFFIRVFIKELQNQLTAKISAEEFHNISIIKKIRIYKDKKVKYSINLEMFQLLLNTPRFRDALELICDPEYLIHQLQISRVKPETKLEFMSRIPIFQKAFRSGKFKGINK